MRRFLILLALAFAIVAAPFASSAGGPSYCAGPAGIIISGRRMQVLPKACVPCSASLCAKLPTCLPLMCTGTAQSVETSTAR